MFSLVLILFLLAFFYLQYSTKYCDPKSKYIQVSQIWNNLFCEIPALNDICPFCGCCPFFVSLRAHLPAKIYNIFIIRTFHPHGSESFGQLSLICKRGFLLSRLNMNWKI